MCRTRVACEASVASDSAAELAALPHKHLWRVWLWGSGVAETSRIRVLKGPLLRPRSAHVHPVILLGIGGSVDVLACLVHILLVLIDCFCTPRRSLPTRVRSANLLHRCFVRDSERPYDPW